MLLSLLDRCHNYPTTKTITRSVKLKIARKKYPDLKNSGEWHQNKQEKW